MSVLSATDAQKVEQQLISDAVITEVQLQQAHDEAEKSGKTTFQALIEDGYITNEALVKATASVRNVPYVNLTQARVDKDVLALLKKETAQSYMAVPLGEMQGKLVVGMLDADNVQAVDFLSQKIGRSIKVYMASEEGIRYVLKQYDENISRDVSDVLDATEGMTKEEKEIAQEAEGKKKKIQTIVQDSPISKALTAVLEYAVNNGASDIHIESLEDEVKIRARIDGVMREIMRLPKAIEAPLVSRVKILSNLKIDEHRIPQDGQFTVKVGEKEVDLRIAISPVVWGEQIVIRLLDKSGTTLKLEDMGYKGRALRAIRSGLEKPNGMILTSGPTGSGKSTSLYALIQEIMDDAINIVTLEDPVEYKMKGINQIQVNADVGLTFGSGLRSILRQDPDVVMVGEIRDKETAQLAVQAALTGHLVFSTLHTNSAAGILPRLLDMGIEPFLIASTVHTVIGQRLVRRIATPQPYQSSPTETEAVQKALSRLLPKKSSEAAEVAKDLGYEQLPLIDEKAYTLYKGADSPDHPGGYKGRMGLYEVFSISEEIQELIMKRATSAEIQKLAKQQGMVTMREDGYLKALEGKTTLSEVDRVTVAEEENEE